MNLQPFDWLSHLFASWNFTEFWSNILARGSVVLFVFLAAGLVWFITVRVVYRILARIVKRTKVTWDDELLERKFFHRIAWLAPAVIIRVLGPAFLGEGFGGLGFLVKAADLAIIAAITLAAIDIMDFGNSLYNRRPDSNRRPIKGLVQAVQVLVLTAGIIIAFSAMTNRPVSGLMAGLGAVSAVLMLVFQDPLKGLAAGFQISSNDMVRIGDWIELPSHGADGDVIDISLLNVTVRNWDKTYVTIPIQALTSGAFKNWRGMNESGGRRIKRSLRIDLSSIRFLTEDEIERLASIALLKDYLAERTEEIRQWNENHGEDRESSPVNGRALTNIGVFRAYTKAYLATHPKAHPHLTMLVRQLQSDSEGLPMEIYVFSSEQAWADYEDIQSDIFDHLFAVLTEFGLKSFQNPSGTDIRFLKDS